MRKRALCIYSIVWRSGQFIQSELTVQAFPAKFRGDLPQQGQGCAGVPQPGADLLRAEDQGHAVMDGTHTAVGRRGQDDKAALGVADACQVEGLSRQSKPVGVARPIPLVKGACRDEGERYGISVGGSASPRAYIRTGAKVWNHLLETKRTKRKRKAPVNRPGLFEWSVVHSDVVRITGLEPARRGHWTLKPARLPIPPYPHVSHIITKSRGTCQ